MEIAGMEMSFERRELAELSFDDDAVIESLSESLRLGSIVISLIGTRLLFGQFC